jgi:hypothetical protein
MISAAAGERWDMVREKCESDEERWRDVGIGRLLCQLNAHKIIARALHC